MHRVLAVSFGLAVILLFASFQKASRPETTAQESSQIRVEVEAVNVLVTVFDKKGRFVTDLSQDRFSVLEDKVPQEITNFVRETSLPLSIALLVDTSGSVRLKLDFEKRAASSFLNEVLKPEDQAMLVEFDTGATLLQDFTNRPGALIEELRGLRAGGGTALFDALYRVASEKLSGASPRRVIVVVSDGADLNSKRAQDETVEMIMRSEATVYAIGTSKFGATAEKDGEKKLKILTERTGGTLFLPYSEEQFEDAFSRINEELRSQYSITYVPANKQKDGGFRKIEVKIADDKGLKTRYKTGYYAPRAEEQTE